jgi:hypothetical protein
MGRSCRTSNDSIVVVIVVVIVALVMAITFGIIDWNKVQIY